MTVRIGIAGIRGRMGREIAAIAAQDPEYSLVGGIGRQPGATGERTESDAARLLPDVDVLIDFTAPEGTAAHARACAAAGVPLVCGTTGLTADQMDGDAAAAKHDRGLPRDQHEPGRERHAGRPAGACPRAGRL